MGVYDRQRENARSLIRRKGQSVTLRQIRDGVPADPDKPWKPGPPAETDNAVYIAFLPFAGTKMASRRYRNASDIPEGRLYGIMESTAFELSQKDVIVRDGEILTVIAFDPIDPNGEGSIIYEIEVGT
jgi:hypothetical protein